VDSDDLPRNTPTVGDSTHGGRREYLELRSGRKIEFCCRHVVTHHGAVRTTTNIDDDVVPRGGQAASGRGLGLSTAVNELARTGFPLARREFHYVHASHDMGALVDLYKVAEVLELLDDIDSR
jgi:hypothetical protein